MMLLDVALLCTSMRLLVSSLPTNSRPAFSNSATLSGFICVQNYTELVNSEQMKQILEQAK